MSRPSLFRWLIRWFWGGFLVLGLFALVLFVVNAADYIPYRLALRRMQHLDSSSLRALTEACTRYEKVGPQELSEGAIPPEFRSLKPVQVSFYPGSSTVTLFERSDLTYVSLRVYTNVENQVIESVSSAYGRQHQRQLWERNPELTRRMHPIDRILTVSQGSMHDVTDWIVRPNEVLIIDRSGRVGEGDVLVGQIPLTPSQLESIEAGGRAISAESRGHLYDGGAADGTWLQVSFTADGSRSDDFGLANTWRDEAGPLLDALNQIAGKTNPINFRDRVTGRFSVPADSARVMTWQEVDQRWSRIEHPWWYLWPRLGLAEN